MESINLLFGINFSKNPGSKNTFITKKLLIIIKEKFKILNECAINYHDYDLQLELLAFWLMICYIQMLMINKIEYNRINL